MATMRLRVDRIRDLGRQKGFERIEDLATAFGLSRQSLSAMFNHRQMPSLATADRMARVLGIAVEDLYEKGGE